MPDVEIIKNNLGLDTVTLKSRKLYHLPAGTCHKCGKGKFVKQSRYGNGTYGYARVCSYCNFSY